MNAIVLLIYLVIVVVAGVTVARALREEQR